MVARFKELRISSSFRPEVPLDADDLSEDYDEDAYFIDFEDTARHIIEKDLDQEEEKVELKELTTNNKVMEE